MDWIETIRRIDAPTARSFVRAARHLLNAMMIEGQQMRAVQTPGTRDYVTGTLSREAPAGGWLSHEELRNTTQRLNEAIAAEKWVEGVFVALRAVSMLGAI